MIEEHQLFVLFAMRILGFILFLFNTKLSLLEGRFKNRGVIFNETILVCNSVNFFCSNVTYKLLRRMSFIRKLPL